jgi:glycine/D-amino acid oxidase-like deaminating enzyme/nitrite reductase/ring-hydroxylating ferredoxin subunit
MVTHAIWEDTIKERKAYPRLTQNTTVDIVIIGAGITGLTTAYQLMNEGKSIAILEANIIASGTTGHSTANLYVPIQQSFHKILHNYGSEAAKTIAHSRLSAINFIEKTIEQHAIDCHFCRRPFYYFTDESQQIAYIEREYRALQEIGIHCELSDELPYGLNSIKSCKIHNQARFNPTLYLLALSKILSENNCQIFEHSPVSNYEERADSCIAYSNNYKIMAKKMVIATHVPIGINKTQFLVYPYRSYAVAVRLKNTQYSNSNCWRIGSPYYALSTHNAFSKDLDILIVAGAHHKTGQPESDNHESHITHIKNYISQHFSVDTFPYQWSAQHYQPADNLPYIGLATRQSKNLYVATGYSSDGLTYGTVAGILLANLIVGSHNSWETLYSPNRGNYIASAPKFIKENTNVFIHYAKDLPAIAEVKNTDQINKGEGKIIMVNGEKCAAFRDEQNQLHCVSAVCTHMKCIVKWNNAEMSWDCPCHGSRFSITGDVLEGPALSPLEKIEAS